MKYSSLAKVYSKLEKTSKRLEKTHIVSEFLKTVPENHLEKVMLLLNGRVFPLWDSRETGIAEKIVVKAIHTATGSPSQDINKVWKKTGDLGETAEILAGKKTQHTLASRSLSVDDVFNNLQRLCELEGAGTVQNKVQLVAELLSNASPEEVKYITRTAIGALRVGLGSGTVRDSIVWAFFDNQAKVKYDQEKNDIVLEDRELYNKYINIVQNALDVSNDSAKVALIAKKKGLEGLKNIPLSVGKPLNCMLYQKVESIQDGFKRVGTPAIIEYKYDGFRLQIHKDGNSVALFTRRLENVTKQFPDVVDYVKRFVKVEKCILDSEVVGYDNDHYLPFQKISQRIKRKYDIEDMARKFPVEVNVFDILLIDNENLINHSLDERRELLKKNITSVDFKFKVSEGVITDDLKKAEKFYEDSLNQGNEGVMMKNLEGVYKPGSRVGFGVKVKPTMDTLDVVVLGAEWGEGKRGKWLSSYIIGIKDKDSFLEIGKVGTGLKEKAEEGTTFQQMTDLLKPLIKKESERSVFVEPQIVIEVDYEEIQKSPTYSSGFALRFPRFVNLRIDRSPDDIASLKEVKLVYEEQRGRNK